MRRKTKWTKDRQNNNYFLFIHLNAAEFTHDTNSPESEVNDVLPLTAVVPCSPCYVFVALYAF